LHNKSLETALALASWCALIGRMDKRGREDSGACEDQRSDLGRPIGENTHDEPP
jgi:hypothetical protein